jgi:hypothetical protein
MKAILAKLSLVTLTAAAILLMGAGCKEFQSEINTADVTKITDTTTGISIGIGTVNQTPELKIGRHQLEYYKIPTGLASTNSKSASDVQFVPSVAGSYESGAKSALFGNASVTTTVGVGDPGVASVVGGSHQMINSGYATAGTANSNLYSSPIVFTGTGVAAPSTTSSTNGIVVPKLPGN